MGQHFAALKKDLSMSKSKKVGISGKLAEIKIGENILNVSLPGNYLLRIYLFGLVIRDSSKVIIKPGNITVNLKVMTLVKHFVYAM